MSLSRRAVLAGGLALAGCAGEPAEPPSYPPLSFDYLGTIRIDVGRIDVDDNWVPRGAAKHVEFLAPMSPRSALSAMARDRLVAGGTKGSASFIIEDASIIRGAGSYEASFAVRLDIADEGGTRLGGAVARVAKVRPAREESGEAARAVLYDFVRDTMRDMNVEFEFQLKQALKTMLQATDAVAPTAAKVESEDLAKPGPQGGVLGVLPVVKP